MTEQEELWEILENAMKKKDKKQLEEKQLEEKQPDACSFCKKKTKKLTRESVGYMYLYLCEDCMSILEQTRKKLG